MNYANNAFAVLNGAISNVATAITLATGQGARFPASEFRVTLIGYDGSGNENAWEICHCTSRSGDVLTVTRGQEGTTAVSWGNATRIENRITAGTMNLLLETTGGTVTGPVTFTNGASTALKVGLTGLVSIGGEAGSADARLTVTNAGAVGLEVSLTAIAGATRLLSYNRAGMAFAPMTLSASEHRLNVGGSDVVTVAAGGMTYTGTLTGGTGVVNLGSGQLVKDASGNVGIGTASPSARLELGVGAAYGGMRVKGTSSASNGFEVALSSNGTTGNFWLYENGSIRFATNNAERMTLDASGNLSMTSGALREKSTAIAASNIDLATGNMFTRTISGATTFAVSNVATSGNVSSFILDLTNGGSATVTWWANMRWAGGTAPTLTAAGRDVLGFFTHNGGTTWTGLLLGKDVK